MIYRIYIRDIIRRSHNANLGIMNIWNFPYLYLEKTNTNRIICVTETLLWGDCWILLLIKFTAQAGCTFLICVNMISESEIQTVI